MDETNKTYGEIEEIIDEVEQTFKQIKKFDILPCPPYDHHFSYEKRIDLMRAVIAGPPDTPYVHGLFFFDILFPRNYPNCPPMLYYHSYDLDLNQYLNPKGKVSLGLLECGSSVTNWDKDKGSLYSVELQEANGWQRFMLKLFLELYGAFEQNGTYCKHHRSVVLTGVDIPAEEKTNSKGFVKNVATTLSSELFDGGRTMAMESAGVVVVPLPGLGGVGIGGAVALNSFFKMRIIEGGVQ
ncbi:hypothetical protein RND71_001689 [Anisodus tanguticus]|uniref:UBC core domain-containing protein n=1 Tax=Anisodus tanguticus TaxID=243964 RepID=A0AAE1T1D8_9SOLA|nr:hypothetical protein RND71_001689 [Anisodus tanguticus]